MKIKLLIYLLVLVQTCFSQKTECSDSTSKVKAIKVINNLENNLKRKNYLLFSIADKWYLIIVEKTDSYKKYYYIENELINTNCINKPNKILAKAFDKNLYKKGYTNLNSDFYKLGYELSDGNITYFYFMDKDKKKYGEAKLTTIIKPNPIDESVYNFLLINLLAKIPTKYK